jgi:radical SAM protein (TIGR01212 family)
MRSPEIWQGSPYFPISLFYQNKFGEKVWKIPVSTATTCPNREGIRGMKVCNFCDEWGSAAFPEEREKGLSVQIETIRDRLQKRYNANKFLVYFQAYTNTFAKTQTLRQQLEVALKYKEVVGIVIGTRPDCISDAVLELWQEYSQRTYVAVELGVQSFDEEQLLWMRRGHTAQKSIESVLRIRQACPDLDIGIHLMFGLPGDNLEMMKRHAEISNALPINNVKLHNLHVLKNTPLEEDFHKGLFTPLEREAYAELVMEFLKHLRPDLAVHRLTAVASRHEELIAPKWVANKMASYQFMLDTLAERKVYQGMNYQKNRQTRDSSESISF